jgi:hypothetical protein
MDVDEFGKDAGFLPLFPLGLVVAPLLLQGDMVLVFFDDEGEELLLCRLPLLLRNLFCLLFLFPQMVDQPLHHLRADGAFLVLGKDYSSRFLGGELCGPLKDEGF